MRSKEAVVLFSSLFKGEKRIAVGRGRKRKLTLQEVVRRLDRVELTTASCTLIRDHLGNEKVENYGQVDVFRERDEKVFVLDNGFCITTPTGMKLRNEVGANLAEIISESDTGREPSALAAEDIAEDDEDGFEEEKEDGFEEDEEDGFEEDEEDVGDEEAVAPGMPAERAGGDAYSERRRRPKEADEDGDETVLGIGQVIRLRFFFQRIPYEIDCQIVSRFNPVPYRNMDLTPRFGVGYQVRPLTDVRKRDLRRYIRYTHRLGFGYLRLRNEIQFNVFAHRTDLEIPEKGALPQTLSVDDFHVISYGSRDVTEVHGVEKLEDLVDFFKSCIMQNPTERRSVYISKPHFDMRQNRPFLVGLGHFNVVGAQQAAVLPKIFVKNQTRVMDRELDKRATGPLDARRLRAMDDIKDRSRLLTRTVKLFELGRRQKRITGGDADNDRVLLDFTTTLGLTPGDHRSVRYMTMLCEVFDIGVENVTLRPLHFEDARAREMDGREFLRQEDGFQVDLLNFSVGGALIRGGETPEANEAFLKYLVGEDYERMDLLERVEALQRHAIIFHLYPILTFVRSQTQDLEPFWLPFKIPVIARVARFITARSKDDDEPRITAVGLEYIYNPVQDSFSRDINDYDQWELITPYTENHHFIEVHKSLQLLFGFDRSLEESLRGDMEKAGKGSGEGVKGT